MFSLLITIVAIALVAALAAAAIYYGGESMLKGSTRAAAVTLITQANQIAAAGALSSTDGFAWPANGPQFKSPYLTMPTPPSAAYVEGSAPRTEDWEYYLADNLTHHFVLRNKISRDVCMAVNHEVGMEGIPAAWDGTSMIQCFGTGDSGAYTFFYDPPPDDGGAKEVVLNQSLADGNTDTPGYPRLCPNTAVINDGICTDDVMPSGSSSEPVPDIGDGTTPPADTSPGGIDESAPITDIPPSNPTCEDSPWMDGCTPTETVPDAQFCVQNPTAPECNAEAYPALVVSGFPYTTTFTAVPDCSFANTQGNICLPVFHSQVRVWEWAPTPDTYRSTGAQQADGRLGWWNQDAYGFSIEDGWHYPDGSHFYTITQRYKYGSTYDYTYAKDYPSYVTKHGKMGIDCSVVKQDMAARGGYLQVSGNDCQTIELTSADTWTVFYNFAYVGGDPILVVNPGYTSTDGNWGPYPTYDVDNYHITVHSPIGPNGLNGAVNFPLVVGAIGHPIQEIEDLHYTQSVAEQWPFAPLQTDTSNAGW